MRHNLARMIAMDAAELAVGLPGRWRIVATNFPLWLRGSRHDPVIEYGLRGEDPLTLDDTVEYVDDLRGESSIRGVDVLRRDGFVWRGNGGLRLLRSRWSVLHLDDDLLAIRFARSLVTPAGVDVLVREHADRPEVRAEVAEHPELLGLAVGEFASLTWLDRRD